MATVTKTEGYPPGAELVVTQGGRVVSDQKQALRLFKDAASDKERYRIVYTYHDGWIVYHCGRRVLDTLLMRFGAPNPGALIDQLRIIRFGHSLPWPIDTA